MKKIILKDGIELELSTRKTNTSGYTGVTVSPAWTLDESKPFIAMTQNPTSPELVRELTATKRASLHLGHYSDAREAAYVIGLYHKNPLTTLQQFNKSGEFTVFPADLYDQPEGMTLKQAGIAIREAKLKSKPLDRTVLAKGNLYDHFNRDDIVTIATELGGAENFQQYITGLTIEQFATEFNLNYK